MSLVGFGDLLLHYPWGVDVEIPLQASERWLAGGEPYITDGFSSRAALPPFLYPPYALLLYAPLTTLPRLLVQGFVLVASVAAGAAACRRLGIDVRAIPLVLLWPPFTEAFFGGNVQVFLFAAFVYALVPPRAASTDPAALIKRGAAAAVTGVVKSSQPHVIAHLARWDRRAAAIAIASIGGLALVTLPLVGIDTWSAWFEQLRRAADPAWYAVGSSIGRLLPAPLDIGFFAACALAALIARPARAAEVVGLLLVLGSAGIRTYYLLFLIPAMLRIRREVALMGALLIATYTQIGWWLGIGLVTAAYIVSTLRERREGQARLGRPPTSVVSPELSGEP